jgi:quercetin dioxygenase-like cupin family protein
MSPLFGDRAMLNLLDFEPGASVPEHSHPHEQLGLVIDGELWLRIGGIDHHLTPGHGYQIPGGVAHAAWTDKVHCRVLDVFQPVREDYLRRVENPGCSASE